MRILAIRGQNLASLEAPFEVDLDAEPLRSAGLFAITGNTGAGKSTILDAMCLALYGDCPRLSAAGINDDIPDASGESIKSRDARSILRTGASFGEAVADVLADDGVRYRISWIARRARGRADGRLQNVERSLIRLDDGQILDTQFRSVNERVRNLIGLTYDEFRRSVLLAQGDFDAFLRADTAERAGLLEKVTATHLYRDISRRIYERDAAASEALNGLELRMGENRLLTEEERSGVRAEYDGLETELTEADVIHGRVTSDIGRHETVLRLTYLRDEAGRRLEEVRQAGEALTPERAQLNALDQAEPVRAIHELDMEARRIHAEAEQSLLLARAGLEKAQAAEETDREHAASAASRLEEAERIFKEFGPIWSEATRLDGQISTAARETESARSQLDGAVRDETSANAGLSELTRKETENAVRRDEARLALDRIPNFGPVAEVWAVTVPRFDELIRVRAASDEATRREAAARQALSASERSIIAAREKLDAGEAEIRSADLAVSGMEAEIAAIESGKPDERLSRLLSARGVLVSLTGFARTIMREEEAASGHRGDIERSRAGISAAETEIVGLTAIIRDAETAEGELSSTLTRAELALGEHARLMRAQLVDDEPCPVCGSRNHPDTDAGPFAEMVSGIRERLVEIGTKKANANDRLRDENKTLAAARALLQGAEQALARSEASLLEARSGWLADLGNSAIDEMRPALPETPDPARLDEIGRKMDQREAEIRGLLRDLGDKRRSRDGLIGSRTSLTLERERAQTALNGLQETMRGHENTAALAAQSVATSNDQAARIVGDLSVILKPAAVTPDALHEDPEAVRLKLAKVVTWYQSQTMRLREAEENLSALAGSLAGAREGLRAVIRRKTELQTAVSDRQAGLDDLRAQRKSLLGGEETETHRSRHNTARLELAALASRAASRASGSASTLKAAGTAVESASGAVMDASGRVSASGQRLKAAVIESGLDQGQINIALAAPKGERDRLRGIIRLADERVTASKSAFLERQRDLDGSLDGGLPETGLDTLRAELAELVSRIRNGRGRMGELSAQLQRDEADRKRLADLAREIGQARSECDTWSAVNAAVGSAAGGKFARVAQAVTLAVLVDRANDHLGMFKPRYRLIMGGADLALHVLDQDMADEVRSTRSLSGGERFLVSLSLALALSGLGKRGGLAETLFIDEGFGSLDGGDLEMAIEALEMLQGQGRSIGVISHVATMKDRIPVQVRVMRSGAGRSIVSVEMT